MLKYFLKMVLRNKTTLLWGLIFPIALMGLFRVTFGNIVSTENKLDLRKVDVVLDGEGLYQENFKAMMDELSKNDSEEGLRLEVSYTDETKASERLDNKDIDFYYYVSDDEVVVHLQEKYGIITGMIAREIADTYKFNMDIINECLESDPSKLTEITDSLSDRLSYISVENDEGTNMYMWYYISTLVMGILFDYALGIRVLATIRADVAGSAMRVSLSSSSKTKMVLYCTLLSFCTGLIIPRENNHPPFIHALCSRCRCPLKDRNNRGSDHRDNSILDLLRNTSGNVLQRRCTKQRKQDPRYRNAHSIFVR